MSDNDQLQLGLDMVAAKFHGFAEAASNVTPTPLQLFDVAMVVLDSVHSIRLLGGIIRKRKLYKDSDGVFRGGEVEVSCADAEKWGVRSQYLSGAIKELVEQHFVEVVRQGQPNRNGKLGISTIVKLKYDERPGSKGVYIRNPEAFEGFCVKTGVYMDVPDEYYTVMLPTSELSTIKVVSTILRETLGWQDGYGQRRRQIGMSIKSIADRLRLPVSTVHRGIKVSINKYIKLVEAGVFDPEAGAKSRAAVYSVLYRTDDTPIYYPDSYKTLTPPKRERSDTTETQTEPEAMTTPKRERELLLNENGDSNQTITDGVLLNANDIKNIPSKSNVKQQQNDQSSLTASKDEVVVVSLLGMKNIPERLAQRLIRKHGIARVRQVSEAVEIQSQVKDQAAWIHAALRDGYQFSESPTPLQADEVTEGNKRKAQEKRAAAVEESRRIEAAYEEYLTGIEKEIKTDPLLYQDYLDYTEEHVPEMWRQQLRKLRADGKDMEDGPTSKTIARERRKLLGSFCHEESLGEVMEFEQWLAANGERKDIYTPCVDILT